MIGQGLLVHRRECAVQAGPELAYGRTLCIVHSLQ